MGAFRKPPPGDPLGAARLPTEATRLVAKPPAEAEAHSSRVAAAMRRCVSWELWWWPEAVVAALLLLAVSIVACAPGREFAGRALGGAVSPWGSWSSQGLLPYRPHKRL